MLELLAVIMGATASRLAPSGICAFNLINDNSGETRTAVFEYEAATDAITTGAVEGLNNLELGTFKLLVQRIPALTADILLKKAVPETTGPAAMTADSTVTGTAASQDLADLPATSVLRLSNMVTLQDLMDSTSYAELVEDVGDELNQYGTVKQIVVPKQYPDGSVPGVTNTSSGKSSDCVFVHCVFCLSICAVCCVLSWPLRPRPGRGHRRPIPIPFVVVNAVELRYAAICVGSATLSLLLGAEEVDLPRSMQNTCTHRLITPLLACMT